MLEALFVLSCVLLFVVLSKGFRIQPSLNIFTQKMLYQCVIAQEKAYVDKRDVYVDINEHEAYFDDIRWKYPNNVSCTPFSFHYTPNGNISMGQSVSCKYKNKEKKLVFQLGSGRVRVSS